MATYTSGTGAGSGYANKEPVDNILTHYFTGTPQLARSAGLILLFIFAVVQRRIWFGADMIATAVAAAAWYLVPQAVLGFQVSRLYLDGVDLQLGRMIGAVLAGNAVLWFLLTKRTKDPDTVHPALLLTRVVANGVLLIAMVDIQLFSKAWGPEHMTFGFLSVALWTLGSAIHLVWGGYPGGHLQRQRNINRYLLRDFIIAAMVGFTMYGFPRWFLRNFTLIRTLDGVHEHLTRAFGALIFGTGLFAFQAVGFLDDRDKEAPFIERIVINVLLMASLAYSQFIYFKEWNMVHSWGVQFALILWTIHAWLGWDSERFVRQLATRTGANLYGRDRVTTEKVTERTTVGGDRLLDRGDTARTRYNNRSPTNRDRSDIIGGSSTLRERGGALGADYDYEDSALLK